MIISWIKKYRILLTVSIAALLYAIVWVIRLRNFVTEFDDSYMFVRYAGNFLDGKGIAWNPDGVQTYGVSSILYMFLIAALKSLFSLSAASTLTLASSLSGFLAIIVLVATCTVWVKSYILKNFFIMGVLLTAFIILQMSFKYHCMNGMDTMSSFFSISLLILSVVLLIKYPNRTRCLFVICAAYFAYAVRPDNGLYSVLFPLLSVIFLVSGKKLKYVTIFLPGIFILLLADIIIKKVIFGVPFPLSAYVKDVNFLQDRFGVLAPIDLNPVTYLSEFINGTLPFIVVLIFTCRRKHLPLIGAFFVPVCLTFAYYFKIVPVMGCLGRYYYPSMPFFIVSGICCLDDFIVDNHPRLSMSGKNLLSRLIFLGVIFMVCPQIQLVGERAYKRIFLDPKAVSQWVDLNPPKRPGGLPRLGWWEGDYVMGKMIKLCPEPIVIAATEHGYLGALAPRAIIVDMAGLHDIYTARNGFSVDYLLDKKPDIIWFPVFTYKRVIKEIETCERFWKEYDYYPGAFSFGLAIRRDSAYFGKIQEAVKVVWGQTYPKYNMNDFLAKRN